VGKSQVRCREGGRTDPADRHPAWQAALKLGEVTPWAGETPNCRATRGVGVALEEPAWVCGQGLAQVRCQGPEDSPGSYTFISTFSGLWTLDLGFLGWG
jgi:hypothetical protein